jgi:cytoskeletal protein CcmA (bactofilin family)
MAQAPGVIGKGIRIKGDLSGQGDLVIEGQVEGRIQLNNHLTIEESGIVNANIEVEKLTVLGRASGNIDAQARVEMRASARVEGEIKAPSVVIEDGANFRGTIQMDVGIPEDI